MLNSKRGQVSSIDALFSSVVFALMLVMMLVFWVINMEGITHALTKNKMESAVVSISDLLVKSSGEPLGWENNVSELKKPGLAVSDENNNFLSKKKIDAFATLPYNKTKQLMGLDETYGFHLIIEELDGNRIYETGNPETDEKSIAASALRYAVLGKEHQNPEIIRMRLIIYEEK